MATLGWDVEDDVDPLIQFGDAIGMAVGGSHYVQNRKFDVQIETPIGRSPRLTVSRYYWDLLPPVAVDFVTNIRFGEHELRVKRAYFQALGVYYIWVKDAYDGESAEIALRALIPDDVSKQVHNAAKPLMGPRRT